MKSIFPLQALVAAALLMVASPARSALVFEETGLNISIPDNSIQGILRTTTVSGWDASLNYTPRVTLRIAGTGFGGFVGDLYGYLSHGTAEGDYRMVVLLNRPGRTVFEPSGYDEEGFDIVFSDAAAADIHFYRDFDPSIVSGTLLGTWQPDGRLANPFEVDESSPRTTSLASLGTIDPNGTWNLFLADLEAGGTMRLESWGLELIANPPASPVPEPSQILSALFVAGLLLATAAPKALRRLAIRRERIS